MPHLAIIAEGFDANQYPTTVRIHSECLTGDIFGSARCDCGAQLHSALATISKERGVLIYLRQEGRGIGLINKLKAYNLQDQGLNTAEANTHLGYPADGRHYRAAIQILKDLGIQKVRLLTNNPEKMEALDEADIEVVERIPIVIPPQSEDLFYQRTKQDLMGHILGL